MILINLQKLLKVKYINRNDIKINFHFLLDESYESLKSKSEKSGVSTQNFMYRLLRKNNPKVPTIRLSTFCVELYEKIKKTRRNDPKLRSLLLSSR